MKAKKKPETQLDARERLLDAAVRIFALHGYEGASTRMLAGEAGVNISAIPYYFNSKEGLYKAVLARIGARVKGEMQSQALQIREALEDDAADEAQLLELLDGFVEGFTRFLLGDTVSPHLVRILVREQMDPTPAFEDLYLETVQPMHETMTRLLARLGGMAEDAPEAMICAHTMLGQAMIFKTHREVALRRLGWREFGEREAQLVVGQILRQCRAIVAENRKGGAA